MRFKPDNKIPAYFDFVWYYDSIPDGVDFNVTMSDELISLSACGFGCLERHTSDCYKNGHLTVQVKDVPRALLRKIKKEAGE